MSKSLKMGDNSTHWPDLERVEFADPDGHSIRYYRIKGTDVLLPIFPNLDQMFKELPLVKARHDDILICGYAKCGTHWVWEMTGMLTQGQAEYIPAKKDTLMIEALEHTSALSALPSPRILNTHLSSSYIPPDFIKSKTRIIYLVRNPKDMLVSFYNHTFNLFHFCGYDGKWGGYFELFMQGKVFYGDWFRYVLEWEQLIESRPDLPIHLIYYEDMKQDPVSEIRRLSKFLGTADDTELCEKIAEKCSFKKMKAAKSASDDDKEKAFWRDGKPLMYRKGEIGDWKNWFTVSQSERLDEKLGQMLSNSKLRFTYVM